ncbi:GNAT family N-acetyltransferase [Planococcus sp. N064]|uniref:GNAT family N-acetyltransferase n=1 Tax=Planococcus liqunii TaxID=3058394 RepID=A0ABT8MTA8_9BACL|nr:GNAT family N-acetyltransferase [Planococcus sp. N064]MDN7228091.1 GNAT family N-acetyltransferase [Planococcus sp. N064]
MKFRTILDSDLEKVDALFQECLKDLLKRERFNDDGVLWTEEVDRLNQAAQKSIVDPVNRFFVAEKEKKLLGTIALQTPGKMLNSMVDVQPGELEVACVYVHPEHQRSGIGDFLFQQACRELKAIGKQKFYLDAGFTSSQQYWLSKLGEPSRLLENYWGPGKPHMV